MLVRIWNQAVIAVLGGTFDPVHFGHLRVALEVQERISCAEVRFVPCSMPPHRPPPVASVEQRLEMLRLATLAASEFTVDQRELRRTGPSYTVDTLASLRDEGATKPLVLIIGMDAFVALDTWHEWRRLTEYAHLIVVERPGTACPDTGPLAAMLRERLTTDPAELHGAPAGRILLCSTTHLDISATAIRAMVAADRSPRYLIPDVVFDYIRKERLYVKR